MWRLILDLASPEIQSFIDSNDEDLASLAYILMDDITAVVVKAGRVYY